MADDGKKPDPKGGKPEEKTFTQEDLEHELGERLKRERAKYADYDELKAKAAKFDDLEASSKSDLDKLTEQIEGLKKSQADSDQKALRAEVAMAKGLTAPQAKRLAGTTREELEADADEILEAFPAPPSTEEGGTRTTPPPSRKPAPTSLKGGSDPTQETEDDLDPVKLAESIPRP